ncbi:MAG: DUF932 domain-containing protein, partial [Gammaproteobacteria bacterium]|nr:DUF932 domain-containing protein [Gammaproteobacteria bacterium]
DKTETYEPVPNKFLIELIKETSGDYGYEISSVEYKASKGGNIVLGTFSFEGIDEDMGAQMAFLNSYDKSRRVTIATGAVIFVCTNGMINAEEVFVRKHTGSVRDDVMDTIENQILRMRDNYDDLISFKETTKLVSISIEEMYRLSGDLFFSTELVSSQDLSKLKKQFSDKNFGITGERVNLFQIYNWFTEIFKETNSMDHIQRHIKFHNYFNSVLPKYL